jgi:hypothetical protein
MKDFKEFEMLLASKECQDEWNEIHERITNDFDENGKDIHVYASLTAMSRAHFELRKYHEWLNG